VIEAVADAEKGHWPAGKRLHRSVVPSFAPLIGAVIGSFAQAENRRAGGSKQKAGCLKRIL
jgi:hypothetical protein